MHPPSWLTQKIRLSARSKAGLRPATQIRVSGCSGMALAHSRRTSIAGSKKSVVE